ncbi:MAG TPA: formylglycine-generating enzyme family protein [Thiobacillaceae bacterium]|nr:formylglycine-generating enzyme family protein [Thiobacillaceae bacterium]HNU64100.1 formylglycine-generating enzyme family protein [Thiobacillaceae bacterium]
MPPPRVQDMTPARLRAWQAETASRWGLDVRFRDWLQSRLPGPELMVIPAGISDLGASAEERGFQDQARHQAHIATPFALGRFCITADEFETFVQATDFRWADHLMRSEGRQPVINIDRLQADAYLDWLSAQTGQRYRLPTETEWEYACRAGSAGRYCFGEALGCNEANTGSFRLEGRSNQGWRRLLPFCAPLGRTVDVGLYPANPWGLHDMHGNVWEFTADPWVGPIDPLRSAPLGSENPWFVTKGGSWFESAWQSRSAARKPRRINELDTNLGLRVLRELG